MKNTSYFRICIFLLGLVAGSSLSAQALRGGYFSENATLRNRLNPAMMPSHGYIGIPGIGNLAFGVYSNLGADNFLFPTEGSLLTFLHPDVPAADFLAKLPENPYLNAEMDADVLSFGFYSRQRSFWSFDVSVRADVQTNLARDLFVFAKQGISGNPTHYTLRDLSIHQDLYAEAALGYSRDLSDWIEGLHVGAKAKFLVALERIYLKINRADLTFSHKEWSVNTDAVGIVMGKGIRMPKNQNEKFVQPQLKDMGIGGFGFGVDLGVEYEFNLGIPFLDGLRLSASVTDLGLLNFQEDYVQQLTSAGSFTYKGLQDVVVEDYDLEAAFSRIMDEIVALGNFQEVDLTEGSSYSTTPRLYLGVEYPFCYNKMSVGMLYYSRFRHNYTEQELTFSYNLRPCRWFAVGVNYSTMNYANSIGWLLEITPKRGLNFFIGSDYTVLNITPQFLPIDQFVTNLRFGLSVALGGPKEK